MNDDYYMEIAINEARKALKHNEIPVGAVVVENDKVIAKSYNKKDSTKIVTKHAEIIVIEKACKYKKDWRLNDCTLYVTLEPCPMCCGAIQQSRFKRIVYGCSSNTEDSLKILKSILNNEKLNHQVDITRGVLETECSSLIKAFFYKKR